MRRLALAALAALAAWRGASLAAATLGEGPWRVVAIGLPLVAAAAFVIGQLNEWLHLPPEDALPLEEPSALNPGPLAMPLFGFAAAAVLIGALHTARPDAFELRRALGALVGVFLITLGRSDAEWSRRLAGGPLPTPSSRRRVVGLGLGILLWFLAAPDGWLSCSLALLRRRSHNSFLGDGPPVCP